MMGAGPYFVTSVSREFTPGAGSSRQLPTEGMRPWRVMRRLSLAIAAALACAAPPPGAPGWRILGPGGGGSLFHPTVSPHDSRTALVACDMTGSYLTHLQPRRDRAVLPLRPHRRARDLRRGHGRFPQRRWRRDVAAFLPARSAHLHGGRPRVGESPGRRPAHRGRYRLGHRP